MRLDADRLDRRRRQRRIPLGTIRDGMTARQRPPAGQRAIGGLLTPLDLPQRPLVAGSGHQHGSSARRSRFEASTASSTIEPIDLEIFTVSTVIIRRPRSTDGLVLPAVVSPDLAATADAGRLARPPRRQRRRCPLRVVGHGRPGPDRDRARAAVRHRPARPVPRRARVGASRARAGRPRCGSRPRPRRASPRSAPRSPARRSGSPR